MASIQRSVVVCGLPKSLSVEQNRFASNKSKTWLRIVVSSVMFLLKNKIVAKYYKCEKHFSNFVRVLLLNSVILSYNNRLSYSRNNNELGKKVKCEKHFLSRP